jgi:pilus assembly protein Flp/PilA
MDIVDLVDIARNDRARWRSMEMTNLIQRFIRDEEGQDLVEYAFLLAFIALIAVAGVTLVGTSITNVYNSITGQLTSAGGGS